VGKMGMTKRIICQKCIYYFVTWQPRQPHGCKAYGFKSREIPSSVVKKNSGFDCGFYQPKNNR